MKQFSTFLNGYPTNTCPLKDLQHIVTTSRYFNPDNILCHKVANEQIFYALTTIVVVLL